MKNTLIVVLCLTLAGCSFLTKPTRVGLYDQEDYLMVGVGSFVCPRDGFCVSEAGTDTIDESQGQQIYLPRYDSVMPCKVGEELILPFEGEFWSEYYANTVIGVKIKDRR